MNNLLMVILVIQITIILSLSVNNRVIVGGATGYIGMLLIYTFIYIYRYICVDIFLYEHMQSHQIRSWCYIDGVYLNRTVWLLATGYIGMLRIYIYIYMHIIYIRIFEYLYI